MLVGHIGQHFDDQYIPLLGQIITDEEEGLAPLCLQIMAQKVPNIAQPLALKALNSQDATLQQAAISIAHQLHLSEAEPIIRYLMQAENPVTAQMARQVIEALAVMPD